jgi:hypothetical protein
VLAGFRILASGISRKLRLCSDRRDLTTTRR